MSEVVTPKQAKFEGTDSNRLNDSGYDGLWSASKKDGATTDDTFNVEGVKRLLETCSTSSEDQFWITAANILMPLVVGASVVYLLTMGENSNDTDLGGKRAAIQHYYNTVYGIENEN